MFNILIFLLIFVAIIHINNSQWRHPYEAQWDKQYADECPIGQPYPCWRPPYYPFDPIERDIDGKGTVVGRSLIYGPDRYVNMFIGIPYAKPPLHELRFKPPEEPNPGWDWNIREWDASFYRPACPQPMWKIDHRFYETRNVSEDCLYLNIFQPNLTYKAGSDPLRCGHHNQNHSVMVFVHGDDFAGGDAMLYPGHVVAKREVIVITFNYRLGALGFMSTLDDHSKGNYGIHDVLKVLEFVQRHIHKFCGNRHSVTLVGFGSGAAIVGILTLSPRSIVADSKLFHKAILMDGSDTCEWATVQPAWSSNAREYAKDLGREVGCYPDYGLPLQRLVDCLRSKHFDEIVNASASIPKKYGTLSGPFGPVVDGVNGILPDTPQRLRQLGNFHHMPILAGLNKDNGAYYAENITKDIVGLDMNLGLDPGTFRDVLYDIVTQRELIKNKHEVVGAMEFEYTFWAKPDNKTAVRQNLVDLYSDMMWGYCVDSVIKSYSAVSRHPVYMYVFHHRSIFETLPEWMGIPFGKDAEYLFGYPFMNETLGNLTGLQPHQWDYTYEDRNISVFLQDAFANFSKYSVPTPEWIRNVTWYAFTPQNLSYLHISADWMYMNINYRQSHFAFWRDYFPIMSSRWPITTTPGPTPYPNKVYRISTWSLMGACIIVLFVIGALGITLWRMTKSDTELY